MVNGVMVNCVMVNRILGNVIESDFGVILILYKNKFKQHEKFKQKP